MKIQDLINGPLGVLAVLGLSRVLPPRLGYSLADSLGRKMAANQSSPMVRAVRSNLWVAGGCKATREQLDNLSAKVFSHNGRSLYDFYRNYQNPQRIDRLVTLDPSFTQLIPVSQERSRPQLLVMPHYSNFDLTARSAANHGLTMQVLSYPNPGRGYRCQNRMRQVKNITLTPISISSLRQAIHTLQAGGTVFTGMDRPYEDSSLHPIFFGHPSALPVGYIRMALKTNAEVRVVLCQTEENGHYTLTASDPVPLERFSDPDKEQLVNVERVLSIVQTHLSQDLSYWSMFYPVWPDLLSDVP